MNIEETDLRSITRRSDLLETTVFIQDKKWKPTKKWLIFGEAQLKNEKDFCWLSAYMSNGTTDPEHDSAYALRLPLIGLKLDYITYHNTILTAWIDPTGHDEFKVPRPGYDPTKLDDAHACDAECCKGDPHIIVPEEYYVPPFDKELYEAVYGRKIKIYVGHSEEKNTDAL